MALTHPDGWRITTVTLARGGPSRDYLRLTRRQWWIGDYDTPGALAEELERHGLALTEFSEED